MYWKTAGVVVVAAALSGGGAAAQTADPPPESIFHVIARLGGLATKPPDMPDFVRQSRPEKPGDYVPVFQTPDEPTSTLKSKDELKAMNADLQKIDAQHDQLRSAFPPSAKAVADKKAAAAAKKAAKPPEASPSASAN